MRFADRQTVAQASHKTQFSSAKDHNQLVDKEFWQRQASLIDWQQLPQSTVSQVQDSPRQRWFEDGTTNLCHNAVDRHLAQRGAHTAIIQLDARGQERRLSYVELHVEISAMSETLRQLGVTTGDRVLIYLPMIAEAHIAMLACARIGAIHVVVFAGLPAPALAERLRASSPKLVISASAGLEHGKFVSYRPVLQAALGLNQQPITPILMVDRDIDVGYHPPLAHETDYAAARKRLLGKFSACVWLSAAATSHLLYTSGTSGEPKGILRDTGGYAVALLTTLRDIYGITGSDEIIFTTADVGWVVGHSYGVYAPLLAGMTTLIVEGGPLHGGSDYWWQLVARYDVTRMLTSPGAMRLLRQFGKQGINAYSASLRGIYLAGEANDPLTADWLSETLRIPVAEHYWQTETGWPILAGSHNLLRSVLGRQVLVVQRHSGDVCAPGEPGVIVLQDSLAPGGMQSLWQNDAGHDQLYWQHQQGQWRYLTLDWGVTDLQGRVSVLGRADDVINVGGQRLSTCEIENIVLLDSRVLETAVVPVAHPLLGQLPLLYVVIAIRGDKNADKQLKRQLCNQIVAALGRSAKPRRVIIVDSLPRTRSGKVVRRALAA
ncbi:AMP-binding protein [Serratia sp. M24T3]|uniref:AMP-binding protein n=1 Tax=Serratia sp. M24T3 TaxID=932213 RepID=UPI00025BA29E|nr:AMP-binding protein [Serratia sp. M24T3]EIC86122.1 propionate/CoA ligase [Serratia sp. M24T3]